MMFDGSSHWGWPWFIMMFMYHPPKKYANLGHLIVSTYHLIIILVMYHPKNKITRLHLAVFTFWYWGFQLVMGVPHLIIH